MEIDEIKRAKTGDKYAFENIIMEHIDYLYRIAFSILRDENNVEDAIQNTVMKCYENLPKLRKNEFFKTWLTKILMNECNNVIRNNRRIVYLEDLERHEDSYEQNKEMKLDLKDIIKTMSNDLREIVNYYYLQDKKISEISKILKVPEGTVKSRLSRARKILTSMLREDI